VLLIERAVRLGDRVVGVGEEREREVVLLGPRGVGLGRVERDTDDRGVFLLELR
jgi:hypothetical protein